MFENYEDFILILLILAQARNLILEFTNRSKNKTNQQIINSCAYLNPKIKDFFSSFPRFIRLVERNSELIDQRGKQVDQINDYLAKVLYISNLIDCEKSGLDTDAIITELRERIKWAEETRKHQAENTEYYNGIN
jgi:hypothetical protein